MLLIPSGLAVLLAGLAEGRQSVSALLKKLLQWDNNVKWYALAIGLPFLIILAAAVVAYLLGWSDSVRLRLPAASQIIFNAVFILLNVTLEEVGWRGYALPRLLTRRSALVSGVIIGIPWGILHIGIAILSGRPWLPSFLIPFGLSMVITWMFVHTRSSVTLAMVLHFVFNFSPQFILEKSIATGQALWLEAIISLSLALGLALVLGPNLQRRPAVQTTAVDAG